MTKAHGFTRRHVVAGTSAVLGSAVLGTGTAAARPATSAPPTARPTVVLVHGAFVDGASWAPVIARLQAKGHTVIAAANPLRGLEADAAHVRSVLARVDGPAVLVGHSYAGAVITQAAASAPNVKALVYVAALIPDVGEATGELAFRYPGSELQPTLEQVPAPGTDGSAGVDLYIRQEAFPRVYAADSPNADARIFAAAQRPLHAAALAEPATAAAWHTLPSWTLITTADRILPLDLQKFQADRARSVTRSVSASHLVQRSCPGAVVSMIDAAVQATLH
ncbi:alpha/beta fold hydrolase [Uniformispora flossi]|uniref:alpha/beta hydrolase n=1 Tax=Uniformispora flossi TaxID=3390723 RepID=UPI003C2DF55C